MDQISKGSKQDARNITLEGSGNSNPLINISSENLQFESWSTGYAFISNEKKYQIIVLSANMLEIVVKCVMW